MGDYARVQVYFAESDFHPEERAFMARMWDRFFGPERALSWGRPGAYEERARLRQQAHADLNLPGTPGDWQFILTQEIDGQHYYKPLDCLPPAVIPPFPRRFARVPHQAEKYGIQPTWYAMFPTPGPRDDHGSRFLTEIGAARRRFDERFDGLWSLIYSCWNDEDRRAMERAAPAGSPARESLRKVFERFPLAHYIRTLKLLAGDWGRNALVELWYAEILYNYDQDYEKADEMVRQECASAQRVLEALRRLDVEAIVGEGLFEATGRFSINDTAEAWLTPFSGEAGIWRFREFFEENLGGWPLGDDALG
jgi:hypothetical protein